MIYLDLIFTYFNLIFTYFNLILTYFNLILIFLNLILTIILIWFWRNLIWFWRILIQFWRILIWFRFILNLKVKGCVSQSAKGGNRILLHQTFFTDRLTRLSSLHPLGTILSRCAGSIIWLLINWETAVSRAVVQAYNFTRNFT